MGYLLLFLAALLHQVETVIVKKYGQKHQVGGMFFNAVICLFSMVFFVVTDKDGLNFPKEIWAYGIISCGMFAAGFYYMYAALKTGSYALTKLLSSFSGIITISYGMFILKEPANWLTYVALFLVFLSVFMMNYGKKDAQDTKKSFSVRWLLYVIVTLAANGFIGIIRRAQQIRFDAACDNEFMIISLGGAFVALTLFGLFMERERLGYIVKHGTLYGAIAGAFNGATNFTTLLVLLYLPISVSTPISTGAGVVLSFAISILFYKEKFTKMQFSSAIIGMIALVLLKISQSI